jgi:hypothetical protein
MQTAFCSREDETIVLQTWIDGWREQGVKFESEEQRCGEVCIFTINLLCHGSQNAVDYSQPHKLIHLSTVHNSMRELGEVSFPDERRISPRHVYT